MSYLVSSIQLKLIFAAPVSQTAKMFKSGLRILATYHNFKVQMINWMWFVISVTPG